MLSEASETQVEDTWPKTQADLMRDDRLDTCAECGLAVEDDCYRNESVCWHFGCFVCKSCKVPLNLDTAAVKNGSSVCRMCALDANGELSKSSFTQVTRLQQYAFLLLLGLRRLKLLMKPSLHENIGGMFETSEKVEDLDPWFTSSSMANAESDDALNKTGDNSVEQAEVSPLISSLSSFNEKKRRFKTAGSMFLGDLTGLELFMVKHLSTVQLSPILEPYIPLRSILALASGPKTTFWSKIVTSFKNQASKKATKGRFCFVKA